MALVVGLVEIDPFYYYCEVSSLECAAEASAFRKMIQRALNNKVCESGAEAGKSGIGSESGIEVTSSN